MADMADIDSVTDCWEELETLFGSASDSEGRAPVIPVTYMNSSAALKAFCGRARRRGLHLIKRSDRAAMGV